LNDNASVQPIVREQIFTDAAVSGASIEGRTGLQALLTASARSARPFDILLVDDSSRVARDLADALRVLQRLKFAGVRVVYISQAMDSASEQARTAIAPSRCLIRQDASIQKDFLRCSGNGSTRPKLPS
jgi:DNA invertase Pin-like site-specific DNA recombinase